MFYVVPHACRAAVAGITGVACYGNPVGRIICSIAGYAIQEAMDICPEIGPPISAEEALGGNDGGEQ